MRLILLLILSFQALCAEQVFVNNNGGLNTSTSPFAVLPTEASDLLNVNLGTQGAIKKRQGYYPLSGTLLPSAIDALGTWKKSDGTLKLIAAAAKLYKMDDLDGTWDDFTGATAITAGHYGEMRTFADNLIYTNGYDKPQKWPGTGTASDLDCVGDISLTTARYVETFFDRTFLAYVTVAATVYSNAVYFCNTNDLTTWGASNFLTVGYDDGEFITGMRRLGKNLYVFKTDSVWRIRSTGDSNTPFAIEKTAATDGCIAPGSIQEVDNSIIYYSQRGFCVFNGETDIVISYKISRTMQAFTQSEVLAMRSGVCKTLNQYWASIYDNSTSSRIMVFDYYNQAWLRHSQIQARAMTSILDSNYQERFYTGDGYGLVYQQNTGVNDDYPIGVSTPILAYYQSGAIFSGSLLQTKRAIHVCATYETTTTADNLTLYWNFNLAGTAFSTITASMEGTGDIFGTGVYSTATYGTTGAKTKRFDLSGAGNAFQIAFLTYEAGASMTIYGWSIYNEIEGTLT
jgi:hypothetical protein